MWVKAYFIMKTFFYTISILILLSGTLLSCSKSSSKNDYVCHCVVNGVSKDETLNEDKNTAEDDCSSQQNVYQTTDPKATCTLQ